MATKSFTWCSVFLLEVGSLSSLSLLLSISYKFHLVEQPKRSKPVRGASQLAAFFHGLSSYLQVQFMPCPAPDCDLSHVSQIAFGHGRYHSNRKKARSLCFLIRCNVTSCLELLLCNLPTTTGCEHNKPFLKCLFSGYFLTSTRKGTKT